MTDPRTLSITVSVKFRWWTKPLLLAAGALYAAVFRWGIKVEADRQIDYAGISRQIPSLRYMSSPEGLAMNR